MRTDCWHRSLEVQALPANLSAMEVCALIDDVDLHFHDRRFHDRVALDEIELYAEVLSAVAVAVRPLTNAELDQVLGLQPAAGACAQAN